MDRVLNEETPFITEKFEETYEKILTEGKLEDLEKIVIKEKIIPINPKATKEFFQDLLINKRTQKEVESSNKILAEFKSSIDIKLNENPNYLTYSNILLHQNSIEFTVTAINECFKQQNHENIIISEKAYSKEFETFYLNNLMLLDSDKNETSTYMLKFEHEKDHKYNFDNLKKDEKISKEFCMKIEEFFKEKYGDKYIFEIITIKKGSAELIINSNVPLEVFNDFVKLINDNAESDVGAATMVKQQKQVRELKFSANMIDSRGNFDFTYFGQTQTRGKLPYYQPKGWMRIGLNVSKKFDNGNDNWLAMNGNNDEWAVGFHGFKNIEKSLLPMIGNLISLPSWAHAHENSNNINQYTSNRYPKCGVGVYFGDKIDVCERGGYTGSHNIGGKTVKLAFQCRLNPQEIRMTNFGCSKAYIVPNQSNADNSNIRPYGILFKI